jgi:hypothetical protein
MLNTDIVIVRRWIEPAQLPDQMAISAITGPNCPPARTRRRRNGQQDTYHEHAERSARRPEILQRAERVVDGAPRRKRGVPGNGAARRWRPRVGSRRE